MGACDRGYQQVVGADRLALRRQIGAYQRVLMRALIIEGQRLKRRQEMLETFQVGSLDPLSDGQMGGESQTPRTMTSGMLNPSGYCYCSPRSA